MGERIEMPVSNRLVTAEEFERMPEEPGVRMELVRGRVIRMSPAGVRHAAVTGRLYDLLSPYVNRRGIGRVMLPAGFKLSSNPDTVREPDLAFVRRERFVGEVGGFFPGPPDLAVEVVSPTDRAKAVRAKAAEYLDRGVQMVWIVAPEEHTVTVCTSSANPLVLRDGALLDGGDVIPGFVCDIRRIFGHVTAT